MGVGINIQPNAVRELFELGFQNKLLEIGVETKEFGTFSRKVKKSRLNQEENGRVIIGHSFQFIAVSY